MVRWFWILFLYLALFEIFSILPARVKPGSTGEGPLFVTGAIHVPVSGSQSSAKLDRLAKAAKRSDLDFVVAANLDRAFAPGTAGHHNGVDIFTEFEASTPAGHALLFYSHTDAAKLSDKQLKDLAWRHFLGSESHRGVFVVVAHPSSYFTPWERLDRFPDGIELINLRSLVEFQATESPLSFALTALTAPLNPYLAALRLFEPNARDFRGWDAVNAVSPGHFGVVATDDLSDWPLVDRLGVPLPPWERTLKVASNVVFPESTLSEDFAVRRSQIYRALREGRSALLFQAIHPFDGNDWTLTCGAKQYRSGDKFALREKGCEFVVRTPSTLGMQKRLVLWRDGAVVSEVASAKDEERIAVDHDGAYRLEVWVKAASLLRVLLNREIPYLFYNPMYVR